MGQGLIIMILIINNKEIIIDNEDFQKIYNYKWYIIKSNKIYYCIGRLPNNRNLVRLHRLILSALKGQTIDHINGNGLDNRKCNLRFCTTAQNRHNSSKTITGKCKYKGVSYVPKEEVYRAFIYLNRKQIYLGRFKTEIEAAIAYNTKALELFGEYARINVIEE